jgi:putative redox protein
MIKKRAQTELAYHVTITRQDGALALAETRGHTLTLNIQKGSGEAGFNAAETLLSALGTCLLTNVNDLSHKMRLQIDVARIEIDSKRLDEPPALTEIHYRMVLSSHESPEKLQELADLCFKWGTVTNTLVNGLTPQGRLVIENTTDQGA